MGAARTAGDACSAAVYIRNFSGFGEGLENEGLGV